MSSNKFATAAKANNVSFFVNPADVLDGAVNIRPEDAAHVDALVASITEHGQKEPCKVAKGEDGKLRLIDGFHRAAAVSKIEGKKLWVVLDTSVTDDKSGLIAAVLSTFKKSLTDLEEAKVNRQLLDEHSMTLTEVSALYGRNNTNRVAALEKLLEMPKVVQGAVDEGRLSLSAATAAHGDDEKVNALVEKLTAEPEAKVTAKDTAKKPKRNVADLEALVDELADDETIDDRVLKLLGATVKFLRGTWGPDAVKKAVARFDPTSDAE